MTKNQLCDALNATRGVTPEASVKHVAKQKLRLDYSDGDVVLVQGYTDKSHALFGDFKNTYVAFKNKYLLGKGILFNGNLTFGPGWIITNSKVKQLTNDLTKARIKFRVVSNAKYLEEGKAKLNVKSPLEIKPHLSPKMKLEAAQAISKMNRSQLVARLAKFGVHPRDIGNGKPLVANLRQELLKKVHSPQKKKLSLSPPPSSPSSSSPSSQPHPPIPRLPCIERSKIPLNEHQKRMVAYLQKNRGLIACFDVGTGKTLAAVAASQCFLDDNSKGKVCVVTPTSLQTNFLKELKAYGAKLDRYELLTTTKFANKFVSASFPENAMLIIDEAHELRTDVNIAIRQGMRRRAAALFEGRELTKPLVVQAEVALRCATRAKKVLLLTATPVYNFPSDILNLVAMVKGTEPLNKYKFERMTPKDLCDYFRGTLMFYHAPKSLSLNLIFLYPNG